MRVCLFQVGLSLVLILLFAPLYGQVSNDDCDTPLQLQNVTDYCSGVGEFSTLDATESLVQVASCWSEVAEDIWFSFEAIATDVTITVRGATNRQPGGTMTNPHVAIYSGTCTMNGLGQQGCSEGNRITELYKGGLVPGTTYFIRVQDLNPGTFQLCINNYFNPGPSDSDCPQALPLCSTDPFVVQQVTGAGNDTNEADESCLDVNNTNQSESNSTWYNWVAADNGILAFTISPNNVTDDMDFALYELPNGISNCEGKILLRCMASGENLNQPFSDWEACTGATGLMVGDSDISEEAGCQSGNNNFVSALQQVQGTAYALMINNFSQSGNGFTIDFTGSATFQGPDIGIDAVAQGPYCLNTPITLSDASTLPVGNITSYQWYFGPGSSPVSATGPGPHDVTYSSPDLKVISLTLDTDIGCKATDTVIFEIKQPASLDTIISPPDCDNGMDGVLTLTVNPAEYAPYEFNFQNQGFSSLNTWSGLSEGNYSVIVEDADGCQTNFNIPVEELTLEAFLTEDYITDPSCYQFSDGSIVIEVTNGVGPYMFDFGSGFQSQNSLNGLPAGNYQVLALDAQQCEGFFDIELVDSPPLEVSLTQTDIECNGYATGTIAATSMGGTEVYDYSWSHNSTLNDSLAANLQAGPYTVVVTDSNGCETTEQTTLTQPAPILPEIVEIVENICFGLNEGAITLTANGGFPPFTYSTDGNIFQADSVFSDLYAGSYSLVVQDANGCTTTIAATLVQPEEFIITAHQDTTINLGEYATLSAGISPADRIVTYKWLTPSKYLPSDSTNHTAVQATVTGYYLVQAIDQDGCIDIDSVLIRIRPFKPYFAPNAFSPFQTPGYNDSFTLYGGASFEVIEELNVYDRWGNQVFSANNFPANQEAYGWDGTFRGKRMNPGTFGWYAKVLYIDGTSGILVGDINLID